MAKVDELEALIGTRGKSQLYLTRSPRKNSGWETSNRKVRFSTRKSNMMLLYTCPIRFEIVFGKRLSSGKTNGKKYEFYLRADARRYVSCFDIVSVILRLRTLRGTGQEREENVAETPAEYTMQGLQNPQK